MIERATDELDTFRQEAGLSHRELWLRYFELGGMSTGLELEAFLYGMLLPSAHDHDVIAHAINERLVELGRDHPVGYSKDLLPDPERTKETWLTADPRIPLRPRGPPPRVWVTTSRRPGLLEVSTSRTTSFIRSLAMHSFRCVRLTGLAVGGAGHARFVQLWGRRR